MKKSKTKLKTGQNGLDRIKEIKSEIQNYSKTPAFCKAEVVEMWENIFTNTSFNSEE